MQEKTIVSRIEKYIEGNKYLNDKKYFKTNQWSMAAWDSWAAQGQCGGCAFCRSKGYIATLRNTRATTAKRKQSNFCKQVSVKFCSDCLSRIIKVLGINFKRR